LIQGAPGCGKTTLALQFLLDRRARGREGALHQPLGDARRGGGGRALPWLAAGDDRIVELSAIEQQLAADAQNTLFHTSEVS
jgi:circadian clock protein KaiC